MTGLTPQLLFTALGFTAVALGGSARSNDAESVRQFAGLIESFCRDAAPGREAVSIDDMIDRFKLDLQTSNEAMLPEDRATLLRFYDQLLVREARWQQQTFYDAAPDALIADRVLSMIDREIEREQAPDARGSRQMPA